MKRRNNSGMKIYPKEKKDKAQVYKQVLTPTENLMRLTALCIAFVSVFYFFVKLLFL